MTAVVDLQHITKVYSTAAGDTLALNDVSLTVEEGEFIAIMGPSGSGKSTLMNVIGLLDHQTRGTYHLAGQDVSQLGEADLAQFRAHSIGFVFQSFNLLPRASVLRNVVLPLQYTGVPRLKRREIAEEALRQAGFPVKAFHHKSNEISGGQMQRVAIARALVNNPALILADEPTGNLDSRTGEAVLEMFQKLNAQGRTIVLITHDASIASYAQRSVHIRDGQLYRGIYTAEAETADALQDATDAVLPSSGGAA